MAKKKKAVKRSKTKSKSKIKSKTKKKTKVRSLKTRSLKAGQAASVKGGASPQPLVGIKDDSPRIGAVLPTSPIVGIK